MPRTLSALRRAAAPLVADAFASAAAAGAPASTPTFARGVLTAAAAAAARLNAPSPCTNSHRLNHQQQHQPGCACGTCAAAAAASASVTASGASGARAAVWWRNAAGAVRASHCNCPGLDGPQPDRVVVEFDPEDVELFIQVADAIEDALPGVVVEGNPDADGRPGSFEVVAPSGAVVFSRLGSAGGGSGNGVSASGGARPQPAAIVAALSALAAEGGACAAGPGAAGGA